MGFTDKDVVKNLEFRMFRASKIAYDVDDDVEYIGKHRDVSPSTASKFWEIKKFTYNVSKNVIDIEVTRGAWDDRATLF